MASDSKKKRKRGNSRKKLLVGRRVEVRSDEEGFAGSWHPGTVITVSKLCRHVQYDHLLKDDGSGKLVEAVLVSAIIDGASCADASQCQNRGYIRPTPPPFEFGVWNLPYGLCVDVCYNEAWWEGVIFDNDDGSDERRIFFPDLGDEMIAKIDLIRITQDWDESIEAWARRGTWFFLELMEKYRLETYIPVSDKQIWYDLRELEDFDKIKEWTCSVRSLWEELLSEVITNNLKIVVDFISKQLELPESTEQEILPPLEDATAVNNVAQHPEVDSCDSLAIVPVENSENMNAVNLSYPRIQEFDRNQLIKSVSEDVRPNMCLSTEADRCYDNESENVVLQPLAVLPSHPDRSSNVVATNNSDSEGFFNIKHSKILRKYSSSKRKRSPNWLPAGPGIVPGAEYCPEAITKYVQASNRSRQAHERSERNALAKDVKKHLKHLNWKVECMRDDKNILRQRYTSPDGVRYDSLIAACQDLLLTRVQVPSSTSHNQNGALSIAPDVSHTRSLELPEEYDDPLNSPVSDVLAVEPEYNPQAIKDWLMPGTEEKCEGKVKAKKSELALQVRKHLSSLGCVFRYKTSGTKKNRVYTYTPKGKCYYSLRSACQAFLDGKHASENSASTFKRIKIKESTIVGEEVKDNLLRRKYFYAVSSNTEVEPLNAFSKNISAESSRISQSRTLKRKRQDNSSRLLRIQANSNNVSLPKFEGQNSSRALTMSGDNLVGIPQTCIHRSSKKARQFKTPSPSNQNPQMRQNNSSRLLRRQANSKNASLPKFQGENSSRALTMSGDNLVSSRQTRVHRSSKRARQFKPPTPSNQNPLTVLSWLIDKNVVLPREKVSYRSRRSRRPNAEGRITRDGIKCNCCRKTYTLSNFEAHAGSSTSSPATNIFLEDGRSLLECQLEALNKCNMTKFMGEQHDKLEGNDCENDVVCSVCHFGGDLMLCDGCPSAFHSSCLGFKDVPDGDWFCPSCCCRFCGSELRGGVENVIVCYQCERKYHGTCMSKGGAMLGTRSKEKSWFCSKKCLEIFSGLQKLVGKPIQIGVNNLTWTLLKSMQFDNCKPDASTVEAMSKLNIALSVMHECFETVNEPRTGRDLVEDVIYNRRSELNRLNFQGFYTVLLEKDEELVTVATIRVFGEKAAELPLVGTRFRHRRIGMCRILMNELEKMTHPERLNFVDLTFLDFQGTVICQKLLSERPSVVWKQPRGPQRQIQDDVCGDGDTFFDLDGGSSSVSEVFQQEQTEENVSVEQRTVDLSISNGNYSKPESEVTVQEQIQEQKQVQVQEQVQEQV